MTPTDYEVYYGCSEKCERSSVNGKAKHIVNIKVANAPQLEVTANTPTAACFNGYVPQTWTIKNTGGTATKEIEFEIGTNDAGGHINPSTIKVNGSTVSVLGTPGNEPKNVKIKIPAIAIGESVIITFDQYLSAPNGDAADCASAPTSFTNNNNYFGASFTFEGACAPMVISREITKEVTYSFDGKHIGEIDILKDENFEADFLFKNFKIPSAGLVAGDSFSVVITLSADLIIRESSTIQMTLGGMPVTAVPTGSGSEYKITFIYGTAPWGLNTDLNLTTARLRFPLELNCPMTGDLWYRVGGELNKKDETGTACSSIIFNCKQTELKGNCDAGLCSNGLQNGVASLTRAILGYKVDAAGVPNIFVKANPEDVQIRTFIAGDVLEVSQLTKVQIEAGEVFTTVRMIVEKDSNTNTELVENSGKVVISRENIRYEYAQLTVQENTSSYILEFNALGYNGLNDAFLNQDDVILSLQVKAISAIEELTKFPTNSYLVRGNEMLKCGVDHTATGFYVPTEFKFNTAKVDFVTCIEDTNIATFTAILFGIDRQDAIFTKEFRKLFKATNATLTIPEQLHLTAVKVVVKNQSWLGANNFIVISNLDVTDGEYNLDLETILNNITGGAALDEGFVLEITPTVSLLGCEPAANLKELKVGMHFEGIILDGVGVETPFSETKDLKYNTGIGTLGMELSNDEPLGTFNPAGTHVSWVVKVGSLGVRNFNSVWIAKDSGALGIESIVPVSDYNGGNPGSALTTDANGLYRLGDFPSGTSKYYLITSKVINCQIEELVLVSGYDCASNIYPSDSNSGCGLAKIALTHDEYKDILQTDIVDASNQTGQQDFCEELWYSIQVHNGGDNEAKDLKVRIPLNTALGLKFNRFEFSNVYLAPDPENMPNIPFSAGTIHSIENEVLILSLPNTVKLNTLERVHVKVYFDIDGCDFRSGSKLAFTGLGTNVCDSDIVNTTTTTSKRIIIEGGSLDFPELETKKHEVVLDPVLTSGGVLRALYNFELLNTGNEGNIDAITDEYYFAIKFPSGWSIVGNPQSYVTPLNVEYEGIDQTDNRGYIFKITGDISVGESLKLVNVPLKYTVSNETTLSCEHDFGKISVMVFQNIDVSSCNTPTCPNGIDQVLLEDSLPMVLPVEGALEIVPAQQTRVVCTPLADGSIPTLEDITFSNGHSLSWYENEQEAIADVPSTRMPLNTPLIDGRTYYVINRFIADGTCKSNIGAITVVLNNEILTATTDLVCASDQKTYTVNVTLNGLAPFTVSGTGIVGTTIINDNVWTSAPIAGGTNYAFTFTDAENCTPLVIQGEAPVCCTLQIECPVTVTITCEQGYNPEITGIPTIITSCGNTTYTYADGPISNCIAGVRSFARTFTVTDASGNIKTCEQIISIEDNIAPILNKKAQGLRVSCEVNTEEALSNWLKNHGGAQATDACGAITWSNDYNEDKFVDSCVGAKGSVEVVFTATDACGNEVITTATFTIEDKTPPTITKVAEGLTLECNSTDYQQSLDAWLKSNGGATATDGCSNDVDLKWSHNFTIVTQGSCPGTGSALVTFTVTDPCANKATTVATFTVVDTTAPIFTKKPESVIVECDGKGNLDGPDGFHAWLANHGGATATDGCGTVTWSTTHIEDTNTICGITGTVIVDFIVTDACGNMAFEQATFAIKDTKAPTIDKPASHLEIECGLHVEDELNAWLSNFGGAIATDSCGMVTWTHDYKGKLTVCGAPIEVTFTVTDACNNKSVTKATVKVVDTVAPTLTKTAQDLTVECNSNTELAFTNWLKNHGGAEAIDSCSIVTWTNDSETVDFISTCGKAGSYKVTFTATDACNRKITTTATFKVVDTEAPKFVGTLPVAKMTVSCDVIPATPILVATDNCGEAVISFTEKRVGGLCANSYDLVRVWTATDECGNATSFIQTITVEDKVAPTFVESLPKNITVSCLADVPTADVLTAIDNCGTADVVMTESQIDGMCVNSFVLTRTWTATDLCGNSISHKQVITVEDKIAPTFVENLPTNVTVSCSADVPTADVLTAIDNCGIADVLMTETRIDGSCENNYVLKRTWIATDLCGNSTSHTQIIRVEDKIAPEFVGDLPTNVTVSCLGDLPANTTMTALDNCGDVEVVLRETRVDGSCANSFVLTKTWTATDTCGNSVSHTQIITVDDKVVPVFVTVPQNVTVECDGQGNEADFNAWITAYADAEATDNCSTDLTWTTEIVNTSVLCGKTGNTVVKFTVTDECGNSVSKQAVFTVEDTTGPEFTIDAKDVIVDCDGNGNANDLAAWLANHGGAKAIDACSNAVTWTNNFTGLVKACGSTGTATVTFTATDSCGNESETTATFTIVDNEAPVFTTNLPKDLTLECSAGIPEAAVMNAVDACSTATIEFKEERINGECLGSYQLVRTWTATDSCENVVSHVQKITIEDTTAPVFVEPLPAKELFLSCEDVKEREELKAIDSCGTVELTFTEEKIAGDCSNRYDLLRTWTATDSCGNETEFEQTIHVACKIEFTNAISANGDGVNDEFQLKGIECYPGNTVEIFNRWGKLVYTTTNYNSNGNVFKGFANTKHVVSGGEKLPTGTYFYVVKYDFSLGNGNTQAMDQSGYIHLESN